MTIQNGFFKSINGDRRYLAEFFTSYFASFIGNGVFPNPSTNLQVIANQNFATIVRPGKGWINGHYLNNDDNIVINHQPPDGVLRRIDRIVFAVNLDSRSMDIYLKQGTPSTNAQAPALLRNSTIYELALADIAFNPGMTSISQSNITDQRMNGQLCGIVHGVVQQLDTTTLFNQYQQFLVEKGVEFDQQLAVNQETFDTWFAQLNDILDGDVAANLANMIITHTNNATSQKHIEVVSTIPTNLVNKGLLLQIDDVDNPNNAPEIPTSMVLNERINGLTQQTESIKLNVSKFPRMTPENSDSPRILRAIYFANENNYDTVYLDENNYTLDTLVDVAFDNIKIVGRESFTRINVANQTSGIRFQNKANVGADKLMFFSNNVSLQNQNNALAINFTECTNVKVGNLEVDGFNVGAFFKNCTGVEVDSIKVSNSVLNSDAVTGYGVNTEGSKNVYIKLIKSYNCERHTFYAGAQLDKSNEPSEQHVDKIIAVWDKGFASPANHQAAFKTFYSKNITAGEIYAEGLKEAIWISAEAYGVRANTVVARNMFSVPLNFFGEGIESVINDIVIGSLDVDHSVKQSFSVIQSRLIYVDFLKIDTLIAKNYNTVIDSANILNASYGTINADRCDTVIRSQTSQNTPYIGKIIASNLVALESNYTTGAKSIDSGVLDVTGLNLITVNDIGNISEFKGGVSGQMLHVYFNSAGDTTLIHDETKLFLLQRRNTSYKRYQHATFIKNRGLWYEIATNLPCYGTTANRPSNRVPIGFQYFDTTLNRPIYWTGTVWVGSDSVTV